jgi:hypothetical protein
MGNLQIIQAQNSSRYLARGKPSEYAEVTVLTE